MGGSKLPCRGLEAPHGALPTSIPAGTVLCQRYDWWGNGAAGNPR